MVNMTLAIPREMHSAMKKYSEIKWTEIARTAIKNKLSNLEASEKEPLKQYSLKRLVKEGEDAEKLFEF